MTLIDLTGQESGIVIYPNGDTIVCNWSTVCPGENELPKLFSDSILIGWDGDDIVADQKWSVNDWRTEITSREGDLTLLYDANNDLSADAKGCPATVYALTDGTLIIAPEDWA